MIQEDLDSLNFDSRESSSEKRQSTANALKNPKPAPPTTREVPPGESYVTAAQEPTVAPEVIDLQQRHGVIPCEDEDSSYRATNPPAG